MAADRGQASSRAVGFGLWLVLLTALVSGISTFVNFYAVRGTNSDAFVTVRNLAVAGLLLPIGLLAGRAAPRRLRARDWARLGAIGLLGGGIPFLLFFHGLALASAGGGAASASFAYRSLFLIATVLGGVALHERLHRHAALAAGLLLAGNALLLSWTGPLWTDGTGFVLAATVLWAAEYAVSRRVLRDLPSTTVALGRMGFGALVLVGYLSATSGLSAIAGLSGGQWAWVAVSALLLCAFVTSWYAGLARVDVGRATALLTLGFPITWTLSFLVRGGPLTVLQAVGALAVVAGGALAVGYATLRDGWTAVVSRLATRRSPGP